MPTRRRKPTPVDDGPQASPAAGLHSMLSSLLPDAEGASEYVIAVMLDIRGFSAYSTKVDSAEAAVYLKRVYLAVLHDYFPNPTYFKLTGDGMLLVFVYGDDRAAYSDLVTRLLGNSVRLVENFPKLTQGDFMLTSSVPQELGIGIARGPATRIHTGSDTLDYSGRVLNLAARLTAMARPMGVVITAGIGQSDLGEDQPGFSKADVYVRGISPQDPVPVLFQTDVVVLTPSVLKPIAQPDYRRVVRPYTLRSLKAAQADWTSFELPEPALESSVSVKSEMPQLSPARKPTGMTSIHRHDDFRYRDLDGTPTVLVNTRSLEKKAVAAKLRLIDEVVITISYRPVE